VLLWRVALALCATRGTITIRFKKNLIRRCIRVHGLATCTHFRKVFSHAIAPLPLLIILRGNRDGSGLIKLRVLGLTLKFLLSDQSKSCGSVELASHW
jgi:hypothetical protein